MFIVIFLTACDKVETKVEAKIEQKKNIVYPSTNRWYTKNMVKFGKPIYERHCASCHGMNGEGKQSVWNVDISKSKQSTPSLINNSSHSKHHSLEGLRLTLKNGGKTIGGSMPAFKDDLTKEDIDDTIAYFQSFWSQEYYDEWFINSDLK